MTDLHKVIAGVDASRRAGWARYYGELQAKDQLARDLNVAQDERNLMRRALSRMAGFMEVYAPAAGPQAQEAMVAMLNGLHVVTDSDYVREGRSIANKLLSEETTAQQDERQRVKKARGRSHERIVRTFYVALANRYGFHTYRELKDVLDHIFLRRCEPSERTKKHAAEVEQIIRYLDGHR